MNFSRRCAVFALGVCTSLLAIGATQIGGTGSFSNHPSAPACFKANGTHVTEICGHYTIGYKVSSLMGDPLANFGLRWRIATVTLKSGKVASGGTRVDLSSLPPPLIQAAASTSLSIAMLAQPGGAGTVGTSLFIDTGVAVRPGREVSFNVPSGYNWDKFLLSSTFRGSAMLGCEESERRYLSADEAKKVMLASAGQFTLRPSPMICRGSVLDASALDGAASKFCAEHKGRLPGWCDRDASTAAVDPLDQQADRAVVAKRMRELKARELPAARAACAEELKPVQACVAKAACPIGSGPSQEQCAALPPPPGARMVTPTCRPGASCVLIPSMDYTEVREWERQHGETAKACKQGEPARQAAQVCTQQAAAACNPRQLSMDSCIEATLARKISNTDASRAVASDREKALSTGARPQFLD